MNHIPNFEPSTPINSTGMRVDINVFRFSIRTLNIGTGSLNWINCMQLFQRGTVNHERTIKHFSSIIFGIAS